MVWAKILLGYRIELHIFKRVSVMAVWYRDEGLEPIVRLYAEQLALLLFQWMIMHVPRKLPSSMTTWRVKGLHV